MQSEWGLESELDKYCLVGYNFNIVSCMGKLKTKYPLELEIDFMLFL